MLGLPQSKRMGLKAHFAYAFSHAKRLDTPICSVYVSPVYLGMPHCAFVASRKVGKAVVRNRCKRMVKEVFRTVRNRGCLDRDMIFLLKKPMASLAFSELFPLISSVISQAEVAQLRRS